jgi:hypothetical protein
MAVKGRRVERPGGLVGFSIWDLPSGLGCRRISRSCWSYRRPATSMPTLNQGETGHPGVAEQMLADVSLESLQVHTPSSDDHELLMTLPGPALTRDATITLVS